MNVGENIRKYRKDKGMTQKELGDLLGKTQRTIQAYEKDEVIPPLSVINKLSDIFDIDYADLIGGKERKGLKVTVKLTETDIVENIIRMLKQVALDKRIDKSIRGVL